MPFPERLLGDGEVVVAELHPHWSFLGWPLVSVVAAAALTIGVAVSFPNAPIAVLYVLFALIAASVLWLAGRGLRRLTISIFVTNARVVRRSGLLARSNLEVRLERINELSYHQSIGGRLLRMGEVLIEVGGETGVVVLDHIPHPDELQSIISAQVSEWHRRAQAPPAPLFGTATPLPVSDTPPAGNRIGAPGAPGAPGVNGPPTPAERLLQLDELRRRGVVSGAEYETKKAELLREL